MNKLKDDIFNTVEEDLYNIEKVLVSNIKPYFDLVSKVSDHILFSGGKRLRPLLMVLCAKLSGYKGKNHYNFSTMFEYLHAATLLHDDVLDAAEKRRGNVVANKLWETSTVVLTGDFLLARAVSIAASVGNIGIVKIIADIAGKMSQGEIQQLEKKKNFSITESEYLEIVSYKTAAMFQGACTCGALLASANIDKVQGLANYGYNLGMAFQMIDDLLDYSSNLPDLGKKSGIDLKEGKMTMPVIFSINRATQYDKNKMYSIILAKSFSQSEFKWFISILDKYGGLKYTKDKARECINKAKKSLVSFGDNSIVKVLKNIAEYVLFRKI